MVKFGALKRSQLTTAILVSLLLLFSCESEEVSELDNELQTFRAKSEMKTLGFNVVFTGNYAAPTHGAECGPGTFPVKNVGEGTGTHFKKLNSFFEFCVRPVEGGGGTYPEGYLDAYFEDENGDILFLDIEAGQVFPGRLPGMPSYALSYFKDPFIITGGTGKFEGATGGGFTNDYNFINKDGVQQTSHHWQGKITMKKGKN